VKPSRINPIRKTPLKRSAAPFRGGHSQAGKPGVKIMADGREICNQYTSSGRKAYKERTQEMLARQNGLCCLCGRYLRPEEATFEHQDGRGMNGSHRDDRIEKDGKPYNGAAHGTCNVEKGSKRIDYHANS
jgi:hypothetical protein